MVRTQAEAGKVLDKNTKDLFNEFFDDAKKIVKKTLNEIGKRERDNTRDRLRGGDTLARLVGKSKRGVDWRIKMSGNKNDYGTIEFGNILGPVQESPFVARRASKLDNIAVHQTSPLLEAGRTEQQKSKRLGGSSLETT